jgi:DNA-binding response OmpR family regulator
MATPVPDDLLQELERRLARDVELLVTTQPGQPAGALLDVPGRVAAEAWVDSAAGEQGGVPDSRAPSSPLDVESEEQARREPPPPGLPPVGTPHWSTKILLVDDDRELMDLLAFAVRRAGLEPIAAHDAASALRQFEERRPDLVVLDITLGASSGLDVLRELRRRSALPVIMLTALDSEEDKVRGLELGADDYLTKPFSHRELIARIRAQLRRSGQEWQPQKRPPATRLQVGSITLDLAEHSVTKAGQPVSLTVTEFRLLHCLMSNAGAVVPTATLLKQVWGYADPAGSDVVRVTVHRMRRKLESDPGRPSVLHTIPGVGVLLKLNSDPPERFSRES